MNNLENTNPSHSDFLQRFLERNVRDIKKTYKEHCDSLQLSLEIQSALKKERKPKEYSNELDIKVYQQSLPKLEFVLDWLDTQLTELKNNQLNN
jgi:hypothetical protein